MAEKNGLPTSPMTRPSVDDDCPGRRLRARSLRRNPSCSMAAVTRSVVSGRTPGSLLTTRDTVFNLTPATRATSRIVGLSLTRLHPPAIRLPPYAALACTVVPPDCPDQAHHNVA